jgi:hypothetical protein
MMRASQQTLARVEPLITPECLGRDDFYGLVVTGGRRHIPEI